MHLTLSSKPTVIAIFDVIFASVKALLSKAYASWNYYR